MVPSLIETSAQTVNTDEEYCGSDAGRVDAKCSKLRHDVWQEENNDVDYQLEQYKTMFDENGKFKVSKFAQEMPKDEFEVFEETKSDSSVEDDIEEVEEDIIYDHIRTPHFTVKLSSAYEVTIKY